MSFVKKFISSTQPIPILAGLAAGLYPILFYYSHNFSLINSWGHFVFFTGFFLVLPMVGMWVAERIFRFSVLEKWRKYLLPFLNMGVFLFLMKVCLYPGIQKKIIVGIVLFSGVYAYFLHKHYKKAVVLQFLLAVMGAYSMTNTLISQLNFSEAWKAPVDDLEAAVLKNKPNIYVIQPDGYVNFSELDKGYYKYDNSAFKSYLEKEGFTNYDGFRSNYASTLSSNSATLMGKHHYYNKGLSFSEGINGRETIMSDNTVLNVFKNNGYKTHFISEFPYLMVNHPKIGYDYTNFNLDDIGYLNTGFGERADIVATIGPTILEVPEQPKLYFIEFFNPGHIHGRQEQSLGVEGERDLWFESLERSNDMLRKLIPTILERDPNALIVILADHGGFVGMEYTNQIYTKTDDRDLIYSIFSSQLSIRWPDGLMPSEPLPFKTSVNVFRVLFSHLSEEPKYLEKLQADESYVIINKGAPKGVYKYIEDDGSIVFEEQK